MLSPSFFKPSECFQLVFRGGLVVHVQVQGEVVTALSVDLQGRYQGVDLRVASLPLWSALGFLRKNTGPYAVGHLTTYAQSLENLLQVDIPLRARLFRIFLCESERVLAHLLTLGRMSRCMGSLPLFSYMHQFRQQVAGVAQKLWQAARLQDLIVFGGCRSDFSQDAVALWTDFFLQEVPPLLKLAETLLLKNPIFNERATGLGVLTAGRAAEMGLSGPTARASGLPFDARLWGRSALLYRELGFNSLCLTEGDVLARMRLRLEEANHSLSLLRSCCQKLPTVEGIKAKEAINLEGQRCSLAEESSALAALEANLYPIHRHFQSGESPNGEFVVFIVGDGRKRLQRCRLQPPSFKALQMFEKMCVGQNITDLEMLQISLDIRIGEIVG